MQVIFYIFIGLFGLLGLGILITASQTRQKDYAVLGGGFVYLLAANLAYIINSWWPLLVGFIAAWIINLVFKGKYSQ